MKQVKLYSNGYAIYQDIDGSHGTIYIPMDIIQGEAYPFIKNTRNALDRSMWTFKSLRGANNFLVKKGAVEVQEQAPVIEESAMDIDANLANFFQAVGVKYVADTEDEELTTDDLGAIEEALAQPDLGPYSMEQLRAMVEQAQDTRCPSCQTPTMTKQCYGCGTIVCVYCGSFVRERWHCLQCYLHGYEKPYHERVQEPEPISIYPMCDHRYSVPASTPMEEIADLKTQMCPDCVKGMIEFEAACEAEYRASLVQEPQPETLYTVADDRLALPVHFLTPNAISPEWYSPRQFSGIKEASDAFAAWFKRPARYVDPYQFDVLCKHRMEEWNKWESVPSYAEGQAARFVAEVESGELAIR